MAALLGHHSGPCSENGKRINSFPPVKRVNLVFDLAASLSENHKKRQTYCQHWITYNQQMTQSLSATAAPGFLESRDFDFSKSRVDIKALTFPF
jgi:hypothetical protein